MRSVIGCGAIVLMVLCTSCQQAAIEMPPDVPSRNATAPGPARTESSAEKDPLAYLDQFAASAEVDAATEETFGACDTCHVDVVDEFTGSVHFDEGVGCADCHGPSDGHIADENNEVKPDTIFARTDVDRLCAVCHECSRSRPVGEPTADRQVCTDCHAAHRLHPWEGPDADPLGASADNRFDGTTATGMPEP